MMIIIYKNPAVRVPATPVKAQQEHHASNCRNGPRDGVPAGLWHRTGLVAAAGGAVRASGIAGMGSEPAGARRRPGA